MTLKKLLAGLIFLLLFSLVGRGGYLAALKFSGSDFKNLNAEQMYQKIIEERDYAIDKAVEDGVFKCCINPPCTMCYLEANEWNNFTAGTCACDDLITQGKEPCPQCQRGSCETNEEGACKVKPRTVPLSGTGSGVNGNLQ